MAADGSSAVLEGVFVANVTPFRDDERFSIDVDSYLAHIRWLAGHGVTGVVPFGTNGEGPSVSAAEKRTVLDALYAETTPLQVVATVAEANLPDTLDQLAYLEDLPVTAVMVLPPYYFKPVQPAGLRLFYDRVLAATSHPVVLYHIPKYAIAIPPELVTALPAWGVKDSGGEAGYAQTVYAAGKGVLVGTEDDLPKRLQTASGSISALANIVPEQVVALYGSVRAGRADEAEAMSAHLQKVRQMTKEYTSPAILKRVAQQRHGHPMGTVRPPLMSVPESFDAATAAELAADFPSGAAAGS